MRDLRMTEYVDEMVSLMRSANTELFVSDLRIQYLEIFNSGRRVGKFLDNIKQLVDPALTTFRSHTVNQSKLLMRSFSTHPHQRFLFPSVQG
jgi:hypothetical protein